MSLNAAQILQKVVDLKASDIHLVVGAVPTVRINRLLSPLEGYSSLTIEDLNAFLSQLLEKDQLDILEISKELDFSVALGNKARFRVNAFYQKGYPSVALRYIPSEVPTLESLNLPPILSSLTELKQGLVLVVGPAGHGKSTTIAAMIEKINENRAEHIITLEDPIEYVFSDKKSLIEQRELYVDTTSWDNALKAILRQDPNVVFVGEMRDHETVSAVLKIAETGHLVFATLHTSDAVQTINRAIDVFPAYQQAQIRTQLSFVLMGVVSQQLIPRAKGTGRALATEILMVNAAVRSMIRESKVHQIYSAVQTGHKEGMRTMNQSLAELYRKGVITYEDAMGRTTDPNDLARLLHQ